MASTADRDLTDPPDAAVRARPRWRFTPGRSTGLATPPRPSAERPVVEGTPRRAATLRDRTYRRLLGAGDAVAASVAMVAVGSSGLRPAAVLMPLLLVVTYKVVGLYDRDEGVMRRSTLAELPRLGEMAGLFALLTWLFAGAFVQGELSRWDVLTLWGLVFFATAVMRTGARVLARRTTPAERLAVIGDAASIRRIRGKIDASRINADIVESLCTSAGARPLTLPTAESFAKWMAAFEIDRIVIAPDGHHRTDNLDFVRIAKAHGVRVSLLPRMFDAIGSSVEFEDVDGMTVLGVRSLGLSRSSRALKRSFDVAGASLALVVVAPLLALVALLVRLDSRGPVLFSQPRVGRDGRPFQMVKFRSMVDGAEAMKDALRDRNETDGLFKIADDPRITRVGRLLRKSSLDELPQLFNVLRGEMSLVGPRPLVTEEDAQISGYDRARLHLTPGMTGPWQILGPARVPLREMVSIDYLYVANWSLWRDIEILVRTVVHVLRRGGM